MSKMISYHTFARVNKWGKVYRHSLYSQVLLPFALSAGEEISYSTRSKSYYHWWRLIKRALAWKGVLDWQT